MNGEKLAFLAKCTNKLLVDVVEGPKTELPKGLIRLEVSCPFW